MSNKKYTMCPPLKRDCMGLFKWFGIMKNNLHFYNHFPNPCLLNILPLSFFQRRGKRTSFSVNTLISWCQKKKKRGGWGGWEMRKRALSTPRWQWCFPDLREALRWSQSKCAFQICSLRNNPLTQRCQAGAVSKNICAELFKVLELSWMNGELRAIPPDSFFIHSKLTAFASFKLGQTFRVCKLWISPSFLLLFSLERIEYFNCSKISMQMFEVLITILFYHIRCHCRAMEQKNADIFTEITVSPPL